MRYSRLTKRFVLTALFCLLSVLLVPGLTAQGDLKDTFIIGRNTDSITLDPAKVDNNIDIWLLNNLYDQLVRLNPKDNTFEPGLATSWTASDDLKTYTFTLRDNVKFSDGTLLKASDVKFSLDRARDATQASFFSFSLSPIESIDAPDDKTVIIHLSAPSAAILAPLAMFNASVVPQAYFESVGADAFASAPIGTGPYMLKAWDKGTSLTLEANPNYWEAGLPKTKNIEFVSIPDDNTRILQLQSGEIDAMEYVPLNRVAELQNDPNVTVDLFPSTFVQSLLMNTRTAPFDDVNVRKALAAATDYNAILKVVTFGLGTVANSYMSASTPMYDKDATAIPFDLDKAKDYLSKSAYPTGFSFTMTIVGDDQTDIALATAVQAMNAKIGVTVNIEQVDQGVRSDKYGKADFQMLTSYWTDDMADPDEVTTFMAYFPSAGSMQSGFNDDATNQLVLDARIESDPVKRAAMYAQIQQTINDQVPFINLYYKPFAVGVSRKVHDLVQYPIGTYPLDQVTVEN
jgi:peptide/nickel transport system substrate-binding protein